MKVPQAIHRYVTAVIDSAKESNALEGLYADMKHIAVCISECKDLQTFLSNPIISAEKKIQALKAVFDSLSPLSISAIALLSRNGRLAFLGGFAHQVVDSIDHEQGRQTAILTTREPITDGLKRTILEKLTQIDKKEWTLESTINPNILGGFILQTENEYYDASFRGALERLKTKLLL